MNKHGHWLMTSHVSTEWGWRRMGIMIGCILPDLWIPSIMRGHRREIAWNRIRDEIVYLESAGSWNFVDSVRLGIVLHYIEDFFTYPHNETFEGGFFQHVKYERDQYLNFRQHLSVEKAVLKQIGTYNKDYVQGLEFWLESKFKDYDEMPEGIESDYLCMKRAVYITMWHFEKAFAINGVNMVLKNKAAMQIYTPRELN